MDNDNTEFYQDDKSEHRWRVTANNGEIVGSSSEGFTTRAAAVNNYLMLHAMMGVYVNALAKKGAQ